MFGIPFIDLAVIVVYSILMIGIGFVAMRRIHDQEDFFLGGRRFGKILHIFASFGQSTSSENAVGTVTTTYRDGAGGIWSHLMLLWATPFYWITAPWYRRMRVFTMGDFFRERYQSQRMAMLYSVIASVFMMALIGISLKAVGVTVLGITLKTEAELTATEQAEYAQALRLDSLTQSAATGQLSPLEVADFHSLRLEKPRREFSHINENWLIWSIVLVVFIYGLAGGLEGAVWSDTVQGTLIMVLSFLLVPFAIDRLNELHGGSGWLAAGQSLHEELPGYYFSTFGSGENAHFTWYFIAVLSVMGTLNVGVQANQLTANASARDELTARFGYMTGTFLKRFLTVVWGLVALLCFALYGREISNSDLVWGHATRDLLGGLGFGLVGLMIACLLAALQSTVSTLMLSSSSLLTKNVYAPLFPGRSESHYILVGRFAGALFLVAAGLLCTAFDSMLEMLKFLWEFNAVVAASFWCGIKWRGATRPGAWASILTALTMFIIVPLALPAVFPQMRTSAAFMRTTPERIIDQTYTASERDVEERRREIHRHVGPEEPPPLLRVGDPIHRPIVMKPHAIYWAQDIELVDGEGRGKGMFYPEMYLFDRLFDLSRNPYAVNETIRYAYKILLPFLILIVVSRFTRTDLPPGTVRFFLRMRTPVRQDRTEDQRALEAAYSDPESTRRQLLFANSPFEFHKWDRTDITGFALGIAVAFMVVGFLHLVLTFGA